MGEPGPEIPALGFHLLVQSDQWRLYAHQVALELQGRNTAPLHPDIEPLGQPRQPLQGLGGRHVAEGVEYDLQAAAGIAVQHFQQGPEFGVVSLQAGDGAILAIVIHQVGGHAHGAGGHGLVQHTGHLPDLLRGGGAIPGIHPHDGQAQGDVAAVHRVIQRYPALFHHGRLVLRPAAPVPGQRVDKRPLGDIFKEGEYLHDLAAHRLVIGNRRRGKSAVAHDLGGGAVARQRIEAVVPPHGAIVVGVGFDKPGGDIAAGGVVVSLPRPGCEIGGDFGNHPVADANIGAVGRGAGSIDHGTVTNQQLRGLAHLVILSGFARCRVN